MKAKRIIGIFALILVVISFISWMLLIFTGAAFSKHGGFSVYVPIVFISFFISMITSIICLAGDVIRFIGKMFSSGYNSAVNSPVNNNIKFCTKCGKQLEATATFCSACGHKQT